MLSRGIAHMMKTKPEGYSFPNMTQFICSHWVKGCMIGVVVACNFILIKALVHSLLQPKPPSLKQMITTSYQGIKTYKKLLKIFQESQLTVTPQGKTEISHPQYLGTCSLQDLRDRVDHLALENVHFGRKERRLGLLLIDQIHQFEAREAQSRWDQQYKVLNFPKYQGRPAPYTNVSFSQIVTFEQCKKYFRTSKMKSTHSFSFKIPCPVEKVSLPDKPENLSPIPTSFLLQGEWVLPENQEESSVLLKWIGKKGTRHSKTYWVKKTSADLELEANLFVMDQLKDL
ncbi:MAG: hypothetical protein QRY72_04625 [Candidatus Rhabdochlamydia sp.]